MTSHAPIFHITPEREWRKALVAGQYRGSTLGQTLDEVGFIHCSHAHQIAHIANAIYADVDEPLVVLTIDTGKLDAEVVEENLDGGAELFPHIYGPVPIVAVARVAPLTRDDAGGFSWHA